MALAACSVTKVLRNVGSPHMSLTVVFFAPATTASNSVRIRFYLPNQPWDKVSNLSRIARGTACAGNEPGDQHASPFSRCHDGNCISFEHGGKRCSASQWKRWVGTPLINVIVPNPKLWARSKEHVTCWMQGNVKVACAGGRRVARDLPKKRKWF